MSDIKNEIKKNLGVLGINYKEGYWVKGKRSTTTLSDDKLLAALSDDIRDNNTKTSIINKLREIENEIDNNVNDEDNDDNRLACEDWQMEYKRLVAKGWSDADDAMWQDIFYTLDDAGERLIVARVSPNSKQMRILGKTESEIVMALTGIYMDNEHTVTRHQYIDNVLKDVLINHCTARISKNTDISYLQALPASVANILYVACPQYADETPHKMTGWTIDIKTAHAYYPTTATYIKHSLSAFLSQPEKHIEYIKSVTSDPNEYAYTYIDLTRYTEGPTNIWDDWGKHSFNSKSQYECFCAWVGSIFIANNSSKQACWLQGAGNMGLSKVQNALYDELGKFAVASFSGSSALEGSFVNANVVGKRLAVISDSKNENHIRKGIVHNWTGGDVVLINQKNKQAYSASVYLKVLICENIAPKINFEQDNQMSRVLYFKMKVRSQEEKIAMGIGKIDNGEYIEIGNAQFQGKLNSQVRHWIFKCIKLYHIYCPNDAQIIPYKSHTSEVVARCADPDSEAIYDWLQSNIVVDPDGTVAQLEIINGIKDLGINIDNGYILQTLNLMMEKYYGVTATKSESRKKEYVGIKLNAPKAEVYDSSSFDQNPIAVNNPAFKRHNMIADTAVNLEDL